MTLPDNNESSLTRMILSELSRLLQEVERDTKQRNSIKKYLSEIKKAYERTDSKALTKLISGQTKEQLLSFYPTAKETIEKLSVDVRRYKERSFLSLLEHFQEYCENKKISFRGKMPRLFIDHLLEIDMDENMQTAKIGTVFLKTLDWEKISISLDRERHRIWERDFDPIGYRDSLLNIHSELLRIKPNPVGWVRLEDVYQSLKRDVLQKNPEWKKGGRLVAYYKDEFSADLSKLWEAQVSQRIGLPYVELSGIRDPRLSYKVVLPDGQIESYGHMRPKKERT